MFVVFHNEVSHDSDGPVEVCVPIPALESRPAAATDRDRRTERAHREAYVTVTKAQFEMPAILTAYDAIRHCIDSGHHAIAGSPRGIYGPGVDPHNADPSAPVCDVAFRLGPDAGRAPRGSRVKRLGSPMRHASFEATLTIAGAP
jgi:hypothetical protein